MTLEHQNLLYAVEMYLQRVQAVSRCVALISRQKTADSEVSAALGLLSSVLDDAVEDARETLAVHRA